MEELLRPTAEDTKRRWQKLESDLAYKLAGWLTVASGSKSDKGDAKSYLFLGECKYRWAWNETFTWYIPMDLQWLEAIYRHAQARSKEPLLALEWGDGTRSCMLPALSYVDYIEGGVDELIIEPRRTFPIGIHLANNHIQFEFENIEVPQRSWIMFPWEDLSWLRIEELKEREELGKATASKMKLGGGLRTSTLSGKWPKRGFRKGTL